MDQLLLDDAFSPITDFPDIPLDQTRKTNATKRATADSCVSKSEKITRSRNGCFSCKKLKIKCNECQPICEYCEHTGRECVYPEKKAKAPRKRRSRKSTKVIKSKSAPLKNETSSGIEEIFTSDSVEISGNSASYIPISCKSSKRLNSMSIQLDVTNFELRLLKFYLEFGAPFFTFNVHKDAHSFWGSEVPNLWCSSDLVKSAIYAISSVRLLANYDLDNIDHVLIEDEFPSLFDIVPRKSKVNLLQESKKYLKVTLDIMSQYSTVLTGTATDIAEIVGHVAIAKTVLVSAKCILPKSYGVLFSAHPDTCGIVDLANIVRDSTDILKFYLDSLKGTKFECMFVPREKQIVDVDHDFFFINYLRNYIDFSMSSVNVLQITYCNILSRIEIGAHRSLILKYPIPLFRSFIDFSMDDDFMNALQASEHTSMKIMFYFASLCSIFDLTLFKENGIWDEFAELYKEHSFKAFGGRFEDPVDQNVYDFVLARRKNTLPYDLNILLHLGKPIEEFTSGKIQLIAAELPDVFF